MPLREKNTERFPRTIVRTMLTATAITVLLVFARLVPGHEAGKAVLLGTIWVKPLRFVEGFLQGTRR